MPNICYHVFRYVQGVGNRGLDQAQQADFVGLASQLVSAEMDPAARPVLSRDLGQRGEGAQEAGGRTGLSQQQMDTVYDKIMASGAFTAATVYEDVSHYYNNLGLPREYFDRFTSREIAQHLTAYMTAKKQAAACDMTTGSDPEQERINAKVRTATGHLYMVPFERDSVMQIEDLCDEAKEQIGGANGRSILNFTSQGPAVPYGSKRLSMYVIDEETYDHPDADLLESDLSKIATREFLGRREKIKDIYQELVNEKLGRLSPLIKVFPAADGITPVIIGTRATADSGQPLLGINRIFAELLDGDLTCQRKYTNRFSNGLWFHSLYLESTDRAKIDRFLEKAVLFSLLPRSNIPSSLHLLNNATLTAAEYAYSIAGANFVYYFMANQMEGMSQLRDALEKDDVNFSTLQRVTGQLHRRALSSNRILETVGPHADLFKELYAGFNATHNPDVNADLSNKPSFDEELASRIEKTVVDPLDREILLTYAKFNAALVKTNFYNQRKSTLSFRVDPEVFIDDMAQFPQCPYGIFMLMSDNFRGFHVRFMPVARGGVRMIKSANESAVARNREMLFNENYGLAYTQNNKNKDIPEFGSKGTILLEPTCQSSELYAFSKYMSGMMDLILPQHTETLDHLGSEEIIFFGPDEGTADVMEMASLYSKSRGYAYHKACTTGKPPQMGGIPHDVYGMTTRSVHQFVVGLLAHLNIPEETVTKLQTGGPDGDLGSNEILMSKDKTIGIVDGSGTVFDPNGLDRTELARLADERLMVGAFDTSKLSSDGAFVSVDDENVTLPDGSLVESGLIFRNEFHFHPLAQADLFVPCGGRPEAVNANNVHRMFDDAGVPKFKYVVEGANLFITEDARAVLEDAGVILFKDASTNKGGVTSSSLEVLASLAMSDAEHDEHMCGDPDNLPVFYQKYAQEVIQIVEENARLEFHALLKEHDATGVHYAKLTDKLSIKINEINIACQRSNLVHDEKLKRAILKKALPKTLQDQLGLDAIMERLPEDYIRAVLGYYVASRYIYETGLEGNEFQFYEYMNQME